MHQTEFDWRKALQIAMRAALVLALIYIGIQLVKIFHRPYRTETAIAYTMSDSVDVTGVAVFDYVEVEGEGNLGYLVSDGERVTEGTVVAERYTDSSQATLRARIAGIDSSISLLNKSQNSSGSDLSVLTNQADQAMYDLLDQMDTVRYSGITEAENDFLLAQNRLQISTGQTENFDSVIANLQMERETIEGQLGELESIAAQTNGYFVCAELAADIQPDEQALTEASPMALQQMLKEGFPKVGVSRAGRIVTGFSWRIYAACPLETAQKFENVSSVKVSVPGKQDEPLAATVEEIVLDEENGVAKLVLECNSINAGVLRLGVENLRIELKSYEGIRIDRNALHIVDGQYGVYVKYGSLQKFLKIKVLYENENYILVPGDGAVGTENEVRLYDEIIVDGTNLQDGKLL